MSLTRLSVTPHATINSPRRGEVTLGKHDRISGFAPKNRNCAWPHSDGTRESAPQPNSTNTTQPNTQPPRCRVAFARRAFHSRSAVAVPTSSSPAPRRHRRYVACMLIPTHAPHTPPQLFNSPCGLSFNGLARPVRCEERPVVILTSYFRSRGRVTCAGKASEHFSHAPHLHARFCHQCLTIIGLILQMCQWCSGPEKNRRLPLHRYILW